MKAGHIAQPAAPRTWTRTHVLTLSRAPPFVVCVLCRGINAGGFFFVFFGVRAQIYSRRVVVVHFILSCQFVAVKLFWNSFELLFHGCVWRADGTTACSGFLYRSKKKASFIIVLCENVIFDPALEQKQFVEQQFCAAHHARATLQTKDTTFITRRHRPTEWMWISWTSEQSLKHNIYLWTRAEMSSSAGQIKEFWSEMLHSSYFLRWSSYYDH